MDNSTVKMPLYGPRVYLAAFAVLGIGLLFLANSLGLWWFTILCGAMLGILTRRARVALTLSFVVGGLGWGGGLFYQSFFLPISNTALVVAEIVGLGNSYGWILIVATVLLGICLCVSGTWFVCALKSLLNLRPS